MTLGTFAFTRTTRHTGWKRSCNLLAPITLFGVLWMPSTAGAQKQSDVPVTFTLLPSATLMNFDGTATGGTVPSAVVDDGKGTYTTSAVIKYGSGTHDAVLNLGKGSKRQIAVVLSAPIAGTATAQTPVPGTYPGSEEVKPFFDATLTLDYQPWNSRTRGSGDG